MKGMAAKMDELFMDDGPWMDDDSCDGCRLDFYDAIDHLVRDAKYMEAKVVFLRYCLSQRLPGHAGEMLRQDIFSDLHGGYYELPAYQMYIDAYHGGKDPFDEDSYVKRLWKLSRGEEAVDC